MPLASGRPVRLRKDELQRRAVELGITTTPYGIAKYLGLAETTVWRVFRGDAAPGPQFIASTLAAFPGTEFSDFFEVAA